LDPKPYQQIVKHQSKISLALEPYLQISDQLSKVKLAPVPNHHEIKLAPEHADKSIVEHAYQINPINTIKIKSLDCDLTSRQNQIIGLRPPLATLERQHIQESRVLTNQIIGLRPPLATLETQHIQESRVLTNHIIGLRPPLATLER